MKLAELNDEKKFTKKLKDFNNDPINEYFKSITSEDNYDDEMKKEYIEYMKRNLQYLSLRKREDRRQQLLNSVERFRTIINFKVIEKQIQSNDRKKFILVCNRFDSFYHFPFQIEE